MYHLSQELLHETKARNKILAQVSHEQRAHLMSINYYAEEIISETKKPEININKILENAEDLKKSNAFL